MKSLKILKESQVNQNRAKQNKKLQYITDDLSTQIFNITKDFRNTEYGVFVSNSAKDAQALDMLKQLTQVALQSDKMDLNDVISVYNSRSLSDIRRHFERAENEKDSETSYGVGAVSAAVIAMAGTVFFGIYPEPILRIAHTAIDSLIGLQLRPHPF